MVQNTTIRSSKMFCPGAGKLERSAVLRAVCAGFKETTEPSICLNSGPTSVPCVFGY